MRSSYKKRSKRICTFHQIQNKKLEKLIIEDLQRITFFVKENEQEFIDMVSKQSKQENEKFLKTSKKEFEVSLA